MPPRNSRQQNDIFVSPSRSSKKDPVHLSIEPQLTIISDKENAHLSFKQRIISPRPINRSLYDQIYHELQENNPDEQIIWVGRSSQLINVVTFSICFLFGWMIFPLVIAYMIYLKTKTTVYVVTQERLLVYSGIFNKRIDDLELYRVKDTAYYQPFIFRFFNLSNIQLYSSDISWGESSIPGIEHGMELREKVRRIVETVRIQKGVSEIDYYARSAPPPTR